MEKAFNADPQRGQQKVQLVDDIVEEAKGLSGLAQEVVDSLQGEVFPAKTPLPTPQVTLQTLLASSAPFASDEGRAQAEAEIATTRGKTTS